jgi:hypothetical protein
LESASLGGYKEANFTSSFNANHHHEHPIRGPYLNPTRTSQEAAMRLSQYKDSNPTSQNKEQSFTVDQISKHQYFKKDLSTATGMPKNSTVTARNGFGATQTAPDGTVRDQ